MLKIAYTDTMAIIKDLTPEALKEVNYLLYYEIINILEAFNISTDPHYYIYLNKEYDMTIPMEYVFGAINQELTFDLIMNWIISTLLTVDYYDLIETVLFTLYDRNKIVKLINETFFKHELQFLILMNTDWIEDLKQEGIIKENTFNKYLNYNKK